MSLMTHRGDWILHGPPGSAALHSHLLPFQQADIFHLGEERKVHPPSQPVLSQGFPLQRSACPFQNFPEYHPSLFIRGGDILSVTWRKITETQRKQAAFLFFFFFLHAQMALVLNPACYRAICAHDWLQPSGIIINLLREDAMLQLSVLLQF